MKNFKKHFNILSTVFLFSLSIGLLAQTTTVNYLPSTEDFPNPERGFYFSTGTQYGPLSSATVASVRSPYTPYQANYQVQSTLIFRYFMLTPFVNSTISSAFLTQIRNELDAVRIGGAKIIMRFSYTNDFTTPPYGDATKARVLQHIGQLTSIFEDHVDIIAAVQMGFIGIWGENYYTDYFGDADTAGSLTSANWDDRSDVIAALLAAIPSSRMLQVRYAQQKQKFIYGNAAATATASSPPTNSGQAYSGIDIARIGFHNDCFLASNADFGTFVNYDPWSAAHATMVTELRDYAGQDADFVVVGGETCSSNVDIAGDHQCAAEGGRADTDMALFNYSYLNSDYNNPAVNNSWVGSCLDDVKKKLGYRFELQSGTFTNAAQPGQSIQINISIKNEGYAALFNSRGIEYILKNTATSMLYYVSPTADPRQWASGSTNAINEAFCLPTDIPLGSYDLFLHLPDPETSLYGNPDYSIRLANKLPSTADVWEAASGYNNLGHTLTVNNIAAGSICSGQSEFKTSSTLPIQWVSFQLKQYQKEKISCIWETAAEVDNKGFWVERSIDARHFDQLAWVDAQRTSESIHHYNWTDLTAKPNQKYYYRIKQLDFDGTFDYSLIKSIILLNEKETSIHLFPNPVQGDLSINTLTKEVALLSIFNAQGLLIQNFDMKNGTRVIDCQFLTPGWYSLRYQTATKITTKQFLKL